MATFTDIVKSQRESGKSRTGSILSSLGSKTREKLDPRNYLFKRTGLLTSLFPSLKGYQATVAKGSSNLKTNVSGIQAEVMTSRLDDISKDIKIVSKNSLALPIIAKEINIMRQNIALLVKANRGTPRTRASSFFETAFGKESELEAGRKTPKTISTSPTRVGEMEKEKSGGFLSSMFSGLFDMIKKPLLLGLAGLGAAFFLSEDFRKKITSFLDNIFGQLLGEETWQSIKNLLSNILAEFKKAIIKIGKEAMEVIGINPEEAKSKIKNAVVGGGLAVGGGLGAKHYFDARVKKGTEALNSARISKKTKVISEQKKLQEEIFKRVKDPKTKSFLKYLLKKSPQLFYKLAQKLVLSAGFLVIPVVGWFGTLISLGLSLGTAWAIYKLYQEWQDDDSNVNDVKPELIPQSPISPEVTQTIKTSPEQVMSEDFASTGIDYASYTKALAERESGGNLSAENSLGYVGRYQMGAMALEDVGLVKKGVGQKGNSALNDPTNWTEGLSKEKFLASEDLQEQAMMAYTQLNFQRLKSKGLITNTTTPKQIASYLAASHLVGVGGFTSGKMGDAYGTTVAEYLKIGAESQSPAIIAQGPEDMLKESLNSSMNNLTSFMNNLQSNMNGDKMKEFSIMFEQSLRDYKNSNQTPSQNIINNSPTNVNNVSSSKRGGASSTYNIDYMQYLVNKQLTHI